MATEQLVEPRTQSVRGRAVWIGLSLLLCPVLPFVVLEVTAGLGLDLESAAVAAIGCILAAVATGTWVELGRIAHGDAPSGTARGVIHSALPWLCPTVVALWAFVIVSDAAVVPYSVVLVPLGAVLIICGPVATSVALRAELDRTPRSVAVRRCLLAVVRFPVSAASQSTVSIADSVQLRVRSAS